LDNKGNVPVVFHSSAGAPGAEYRPGKKEWGEEEKVMQRGAAINQETGQAIQLKREWKFRPEAPELLEQGGDYERVGNDIRFNPVEGRHPGVLFDSEGTVGAANRGEWENKLTEVAQMSKHAEEIMGAAAINLPEYRNAFINNEEEIFGVEGGQLKSMEPFDKETGQMGSYNKIRRADMFLENADLSFKGAFHQAYKYGSPEQKKALKVLAVEYKKGMDSLPDEISTQKGKLVSIWGPVNKNDVINNSLLKLKGLTNGRKDEGFGIPEVFKESNAFAMDQAAVTFGNLAMKSYDELGKDKAPMIAVEPVRPGWGLFETEHLKELVEKSRGNFAKKLMDEKGVGKKEAEDC